MNAKAQATIIPLRPRAEVPRGLDPLPPKSRRRYKPSSSAEGYIGRFQQLIRWSVFGKVILVDLRPCYRCRLGTEACLTCLNPRRTLDQVRDVKAALAWFGGLTAADQWYWLAQAGSRAAVDAWAAWKAAKEARTD